MRKDNTIIKSELDNNTGLPCGVYIRTGLLVTKDDEDVRAHLLKDVDTNKYFCWESAITNTVPMSVIVPYEDESAVVIMCDMSTEGRSELIGELGLEPFANKLKFGKSHMVDAMYPGAEFKTM